MSKAAPKPKRAKKWKVRTLKDMPYHGKIDMKLADQALRELMREREEKSRKSTKK